jgi:hypothetical protein
VALDCQGSTRRAGPYDRAMSFDNYKVVLYRQDDGSWVAEIPAVGGFYALMARVTPPWPSWNLSSR